jgi:hypothetical protein
VSESSSPRSADKTAEQKKKALPVTSVLGAVVFEDTPASVFQPPANPKGSYNPSPPAAAVQQVSPAEAKQLLQKPRRRARALAAASVAAEEPQTEHQQKVSGLHAHLASLYQLQAEVRPPKLSQVYSPDPKLRPAIAQHKAHLAARAVKSAAIGRDIEATTAAIKAAEAERQQAEAKQNSSAQFPRAGLRIRIPNVKAPTAAVGSTAHQDAGVGVSLPGAGAAVGAVHRQEGSSSRPSVQGLQVHAADGSTQQEDSAAVPPPAKRLKSPTGEGVPTKDTEAPSTAVDTVSICFPGATRKTSSAAAAATADAEATVAATAEDPTAATGDTTTPTTAEEEPYVVSEQLSPRPKATEQLTPRHSQHTADVLDYEDSDYADAGVTPRRPAVSPVPEQQAPAAAAAAAAEAAATTAALVAEVQGLKQELLAAKQECDAAREDSQKVSHRYSRYQISKRLQLQSTQAELEHQLQQFSELQEESALKDTVIAAQQQVIKDLQASQSQQRQQPRDLVPRSELEALVKQVVKQHKDLTEQQQQLRRYKEQQQRAAPSPSVQQLQQHLKAQDHQFRQTLGALDSQVSHLERRLLDQQLSSGKQLDDVRRQLAGAQQQLADTQRQLGDTRRELISVALPYGDKVRAEERQPILSRDKEGTTTTYRKYFLFGHSTSQQREVFLAAQHPTRKGYFETFQAERSISQGAAY